MRTRPHSCITDPTAKAWWRDYRAFCADGNYLGLSFVEYVAQRVRPTMQGPWYSAPCGHHHPWGTTCSSLAAEA